MFVDRTNGIISGTWTGMQWDGQEELPDDAAEVAAFRLHLPSTAQERRDAIQAQIDALEHINIMGRFAREAFLQLSVKAGAELGYTEPQIYAANIGYRKLKDFDAQIVTLRAQMAAIA